MSVLISPEVVVHESEAALTVVRESNVSPEVANNLNRDFAPLFANARSVIEKSKAITVTDASQKLEIKLARECRLALRAIRVEGDKTRKLLKEDSLRRGKAIDGFFNILLHLTETEEKRLDEQEKFIERKEAARKAQLKLDREKALAPFGLDASFMSLGEMPDETFAQLLENTRAGHEAKLASERKAAEERIRAENERLKEEARIREENARLKREADEREIVLQSERDRAAKEKADAEAAALAECKRVDAARIAAEEKARKEREKAASVAAAKLADEKRRAEEAAAIERARVEEEQRIAAEKARLEREELARVAAAEREARERVEAEARAAREAAEKKAADEAEAARQAALAPDRSKLQALAAKIRLLEVPELTSEEAKAVGAQISLRLGKLAVWLEKEASVL